MPVTIFKPNQLKQGWTIDLSDGARFVEDGYSQEVSPWLALKKRCYEHHLQIVKYSLTVGQMTVNVNSGLNVLGFWQAKKMRADSTTPESYTNDPIWQWYGIGFVTEERIVHIRWLAHIDTPYLHDPVHAKSIIYNDKHQPVGYAASETRNAMTEELAIIWKNPPPQHD